MPEVASVFSSNPLVELLVDLYMRLSIDDSACSRKVVTTRLSQLSVDHPKKFSLMIGWMDEMALGEDNSPAPESDSAHSSQHRWSIPM